MNLLSGLRSAFHVSGTYECTRAFTRAGEANAAAGSGYHCNLILYSQIQCEPSINCYGLFGYGEAVIEQSQGIFIIKDPRIGGLFKNLDKSLNLVGCASAAS
jgi:hypothetical protein